MSVMRLIGCSARMETYHVASEPVVWLSQFVDGYLLERSAAACSISTMRSMVLEMRLKPPTTKK